MKHFLYQDLDLHFGRCLCLHGGFVSVVIRGAEKAILVAVRGAEDGHFLYGRGVKLGANLANFLSHINR